MDQARDSRNDIPERGNTVLDLNKEAALDGARTEPALFTIDIGNSRVEIIASGIRSSGRDAYGLTELAIKALPDVLDRAERDRRDHENRVEIARETLMNAIRFGDDDEVDHAGDAIRDLADWLDGRGEGMDEGARDIEPDTGSASTITAPIEPGKTDWDRLAREAEEDAPDAERQRELAEGIAHERKRAGAD